VTIIWDGSALGAIYALIASGYNLVLVTSGVLNFAQGAITMVGAFVMYACVIQAHLPALVALPIAAAIGLATGAVGQLVCVRPLAWATKGRRLHNQAELITTVGLATVLAGVCGVIWGYNPLGVGGLGSGQELTVLGGVISRLQLIVIAVGVVVPVLLNLGLRHTRIGLYCLAISEDRDAAQVRGINANVLALCGFALAAGLAAIVGALVAPITYAYTDLGNLLALSGFVAVAIGGSGHQIGGLLGGLILGVISVVASRYLGNDYSNLSILVILLITLLISPGGLAERRRLRGV
jgi:branched-chain amino acid transport system permease protein